METRGRKPTFQTKKDIVKALKSDQPLSRSLTMQLVDQGFLKVEKVKAEGRGRPRHNYVLTGKAKGLINLSKNWK